VRRHADEPRANAGVQTAIQTLPEQGPEGRNSSNSAHTPRGSRVDTAGAALPEPTNTGHWARGVDSQRVSEPLSPLERSLIMPH